MKVSKTVTLSKTGMKQIDFDVNMNIFVEKPKLCNILSLSQMSNNKAYNYMFEVRGVSGLEFESIKGLDVNIEKFFVLVQTDKDKYKPSDLVQFRILVVDSETKPYDTSNVVIYITDGSSNRVKQYDNPIFKHGVFEGELQLSSLPKLGHWYIHVKVDSEEVSKSFVVAETTLPNFELVINANSDQIFGDGKITATVKAKYSFDKKVKNQATVTASYYTYDENDDFKETTASKTVDADGKSVAEFGFEELELFKLSDTQEIHLEATVIDELTGKEFTDTTRVTVRVSPYRIDLHTSSKKFKPGFPFSVTALVSRYDTKAPVTDNDNPVTFIVIYKHDVFKKIINDENRIMAGKKMKKGDEYECIEVQSYEKEFKVFPVDGYAKLDVELDNAVEYFDVIV
jgi:CD109 antigen